MIHPPAGHPQVGMLATVRNRRALISSVEPFEVRPEGLLHLVRLEYTDSDGVPEDTILWEREQGRRLLEPKALPRVDEEPPMPGGDFDALVRAARWSALTPFLAPDDHKTLARTPIAAPFFGAVQVEDFQLVPLLQALRMPRVSLLLADDVGLGKTIEAGLILAELLLRRRIRRVLILCPASLRYQWQQEMKRKFSLTFDVLDRPETYALQKRLGLDANPWRTYPRIIASYHYLRQPDVLEQFRSACRQPEGSAQLPWDLLIVDEAHNLMPSAFGEDSDLAKMLRAISPWFEHKLFLTATPHNGHTRSFSGLLEQLDPVRFTQTAELSDEMQTRVEEVVVRRLKREINTLDLSRKRPARFAERFIDPLPFFFRPLERSLARTFQTFRKAVRSAIARSAKRSEQFAGLFAVEVLNKRLLSCPYAFAESWFRFKEGLTRTETVELNDVAAARRSTEEDIVDDREKEGRAHHAARVIGAWFKAWAPSLKAEISDVDAALEALQLKPGGEALTEPLHDPKEDARFDRLLKLVHERLRMRSAGHDGWRDDERLILFTEYKTTLDYLERRLKKAFKDDGKAIRVLFGGLEDNRREAIKKAFNDPEDPIRILVATDAASEGQNFQETARLLLHYEIPWNPSRLEQRNGRLDRHGQARDVQVFHFTSNDDADLQFLAHVVEKVHTIREDLGSMGEVFDAAFQRQFVDLQDTAMVKQDLDRSIEAHRGQADIPRSTGTAEDQDEAVALDQLCRDLDLSPETLQTTLEVALGLGIGLPRLLQTDRPGRFELRFPLPPKWRNVIEETLRIRTRLGDEGGLPRLVFDPRIFIRQQEGRPVFRPDRDACLMHLGHPLLRQTLATFARARFPGGLEGVPASRWTVRFGSVPPGADALLLLTVEELAVNELREPFHHWMRTLRLPIRAGRLESPLPHLSPSADRPSSRIATPDEVEQARELWQEIVEDVRDFLSTCAYQTSHHLRALLETRAGEGLHAEKRRFDHRLKEVEKAMKETTLRSLQKEWDKLERQREKLKPPVQATLFGQVEADQQSKLREIERRQADIEDELRRRRVHYEDLLEMLRKDQARVLTRMLPKRYALRDDVRVFPVSIEIRLPQERI